MFPVTVDKEDAMLLSTVLGVATLLMFYPFITFQILKYSLFGLTCMSRSKKNLEGLRCIAKTSPIFSNTVASTSALVFAC